MPQFFINSSNIKENHVYISEKDLIKHISTVLRCKVGGELLLIDEEEFSYKVAILDVKPDLITTKVIEKQKSNRKLGINLTLAQSILKSSAQDFVIQKATELGVRSIIPMLTSYTVVNFKSEKDKNQKLQRWQKIALESCKQCERADIPSVEKVMDFSHVLEIASDFDIVLICVEREAQLSLKEFLKKQKAIYEPISEKKILLMIGPEGGWSDSELKAFNEKGMATLTLGNLILRAETAVINALSGVIYEYEQ